MTVTAPQGAVFGLWQRPREVSRGRFFMQVIPCWPASFPVRPFLSPDLPPSSYPPRFFRVVLLPDQTDAAEKHEEVIKFFRVAERGTTEVLSS